MTTLETRLDETSIYIIRGRKRNTYGTDRIIGYVTGKQDNIKTYYQTLNYINIRMEKIPVKHITTRSVEERQELIQEKKDLQTRIKQINKMIK